MAKPAKTDLFEVDATNSTPAKSNQPLPVDVSKVLSEISANLLALADVVEELNNMPPKMLEELLRDKKVELNNLLATFGISFQDVRNGLTIN